MGIEKDTAEKILKEYLITTAGLDQKAADRIIKDVRYNVKDELQEKKEEEKEAAKKEKAKVRHGTTCIGIITGKKPITEW